MSVAASNAIIPSFLSVSGLGKYMSVIAHNWMIVGIRTFCELNVADLFPADNKPVTIAKLLELNNKQNWNPDRLKRLFEHIAQAGIIQFTPGTETLYNLSADGELLRSNHPSKAAGIIRWELTKFISDCHYEYPNMIQQLDEFKNPNFTAFHKVVGGEVPLYGYLLKPENSEKFGRFNEAMSSYTATENQALAQATNFHQALDHAGAIVDVGGSLGDCVINYIEAHKKSIGGVFELPAVIEKAKKVNENLDKSLADRFHYYAGSFLELETLKQIQPSKLLSLNPKNNNGNVVYHLKHIMQGTPEQKCVTILQNLATNVWNDESYTNLENVDLLVVDYNVLPASGNNNAVNWVNYGMDLHMLTFTGGKERDVEAFSNLFERTGWKYHTIYQTHDAISIVHAKIQTKKIQF